MDVDTRTEGTVLMDRYVLEHRLGSGGAGVVWRAHDRLLQRAVAVKLLHLELARDPATAARFRSEASSAARLTHQNAVVVYDIGRDGDRDLLVMELVDGPSLAELIAQGPLPAERVARIGAAVASALGLAHQRGMVHRDVKPANVLLTRDGVPKVADFGIARALGEAAARLTAPGSVMGTARYLAPEQLSDAPLDGRVDVYALGLVLHEALTGRAPWGSGTALEIASRRLSGDLPAASRFRPEVPPGLDGVVQRATRLDPDDRFADGAALAAALIPWTTGAGRPAITRTPPSRRGTTSPPTVASRSPAPHRAAPGMVRREPTSGVHTRSTAAGSGAARRSRPPRRAEAAAARGRSVPARETRRPRPRRRRRRVRKLVAAVLIVAAAAFAGGGLAVPDGTGLAEWVQGSEIGDLLREVRDGLPERLRP